mgnify:CR=1 FL=1
MSRFLVRRLLITIPVLLGIVFIVFALARVIPGDPCRAVLGERARAGAYVEIKNSQVGDGSKVPHLSYVGDATIGEGSNIGAATVFVNYDGQDKHRTVVGDHVRVGSDSMLVAPVKIGSGATIGAGSTVTKDAPADKLTLERSKQVTLDSWKRPVKQPKT